MKNLIVSGSNLDFKYPGELQSLNYQKHNSTLQWIYGMKIRVITENTNVFQQPTVSQKYKHS